MDIMFVLFMFVLGKELFIILVCLSVILFEINKSKGIVIGKCNL